MLGQFCTILVWVLIHSLWQGILVAGCVALLLRWLPARRAEARYAATVTGLALIVFSVVVTWSIIALEPQSTPTGSQHIDQVTAGSHQYVESSPPASPQLRPDPSVVSAGNAAADRSISSARRGIKLDHWMPWIASLWMFGASLMLVRTIGAIVMVRRWRPSGTPASHVGLEQLQAIQQELCRRLRLNRHIAMWLSDQVAVPAVVGTLWPCILIPPTLVASIPLDQWRVILAHELAHVRRYDAFVNLVQMTVESLLFFNPAVWWVSHQIRVEREACCDALAAAVCGQQVAVARTLVEFAAGLRGEARWPASAGRSAEFPATTRSTSVMAFADPQVTGELTDRVQRLVAPEAASLPRVSWTGLVVSMGSLALAAAALHWGTAYAVQTAVQLMSPQERVAKLERVQAEVRGVFLPPEPKPAPAGTAPSVAPEQISDRQIAVELTIRTEDGVPIPRGLQLHSLSASGSASESKTLDSPREETALYKKTYEFKPGNLRISASAEGYAAVATPTLPLFGEVKSQAVELVLRKGSRVLLQVRDEAGNPIAGAAVSAAARLSLKGSSGGMSGATLTADQAGLISLDHVGDVEYGLKF